MYLFGHSIIDKLFLGSINTFGFLQNNLVISIRVALISIEAIKFIFLYFRYCSYFSFPLMYISWRFYIIVVT